MKAVRKQEARAGENNTCATWVSQFFGDGAQVSAGRSTWIAVEETGEILERLVSLYSISIAAIEKESANIAWLEGETHKRGLVVSKLLPLSQLHQPTFYQL